MYMIITTTETITGMDYEVIGLVTGSVVQSKNVGRDIMAGFKTIIGGEIKSYTDMMNEARALATKRMTLSAIEAGGDAIVAMRYSSSSIMAGASEVMAYGTAVKFKI